LKIDVKEAKVTTNLPQTNVTAMSISVDGMEHIMTLLTNLYKDPELAVIREYYTNAVDAHVEAGVRRHVEITLPSWDDPIYKVQDFGVGMSKDDIVNIYAQYGASTKRNTNDQVGAFGLGCKSALTITQQFTLVSVKNGMKTTALIAKSESGVNTVNIVNSVETIDGNGTTIKIPISTSIAGFNSKAKKFFSFSPAGTVRVDGYEPDYALDGAQKLENPADPDMEIFLRPKADGESYVIMGNVPYALSQSEIELSLSRLETSASRGFVRMPKYFPVPIGSVDLTPSREGLRFTEKTNAIIDSYISFIVKDLRAIAIAELDTVKDLEEFWTAHKRWNDIVSVPSQYKGEAVPNEINLDAMVRTIFRSSWSGASHSESDWLSLKGTANDKVTIVTGHSAEKYKKVNGYLTPYMDEMDMDEATFKITDSKDILDNKWVKFSSRFTFVDGDDIIEIGRERRKKDRQAVSKTNGTGDKPKISYPVVFVDDEEVRWVNHDEIAENTPYLHLKEVNGGAANMIKHQYRSLGTRSLGETVTQYFEAVTDAKEIILLNNSRTVKALEQRVNGTTSLLPDLEKAAKSVPALITEEVKAHNVLENSSWKRFLSNNRMSKRKALIKDPDLLEVVEPPKARVDAFKKYEGVREAALYFAYTGMNSLPTVGWTDQSVDTKALDRKYPLVNVMNAYQLNDTHCDHIVKYFNMVHEESQPKPTNSTFNVATTFNV
jgi:hypothetical protein